MAGRERSGSTLLHQSAVLSSQDMYFFIFLLALPLLPSYHCWSQPGEEGSEPVLEQITAPVAHAEGPVWHEAEHALYFVDIAGFGVHRYEPFAKRHTHITLNDTVGFVIPIARERGKFVIGYGRTVSVLSWDGESEDFSVEFKYSVDQGKKENRFNDAKADSRGRLWMGTMGEETAQGVKLNQGTLYKLAKNCELKGIVSPVSISNGITWNGNNTLMFYIDSPTRKIDVFDYNICNGNIANRRTFFDFEKNNLTGVPDGMTIDEEDNLWIANWGGGRVLEVSSRGELLRHLSFPAERVTSVAWGGGLDFDTLFVTTMRAGLSQSELKRQPLAGAVFKVTGLRRRGSPQHHATVCLTNQ